MSSPRFVRSGALPVAILAVATVVVLGAYGLALTDTILFGGYVVLAIALPGMLWVRMLRGRSASLAEDVALGLALGYALQMAAYLVARWLDVPQASPAWAIASVALFGVVPGWRRHWRSGAERPPAWWSWVICMILGGLLVYSTTFFATHPLVGTQAPYVDMPYQLALIGELRHHVPPQVPYLAGEPLAYHWFFYVQAAAVSWATGIEAITLIYRLALLPILTGFVVLTAITARHLTGRWWPGPVALAVALLGAVAAPFGWIENSVFDSQPLNSFWLSPTSTFGTFLMAAVVLLLVDRIRPDAGRRPGEWLLVAIIVFGAAGAKASVLPLLGCGLVAAALVSAARRRVDREALLGLGIVGLAVLVAAVFVYRGATGGLEIGLEALRDFPVAVSVGAPGAGGVSAYALPAIVLAVSLVLWGLLWSGAFGLLGDRTALLADGRAWLLGGMAAAAIGAVVFLSYPGDSQLYYLRGTIGVFGLLAAWGIAVLAGRSPPSRATLIGVAAALGIGAAVAVAVQALGPDSPPETGRGRLPIVAAHLVAPVGVLLVGVAIAAFGVHRLARGRVAGSTGLIMVALAMGLGLPSTYRVVTEPFFEGGPSGTRIPDDGIAAARWLRAHSGPSDLVATNLHCGTVTRGRCDARHFWISAWSERRVLIEGWAYTEDAFREGLRLGVSDRIVPYWDPARLAANDRAFEEPAVALAPLRDREGVRWLFADVATADEAALGGLATLRFQAGQFAVYEVGP